MLVLVVEDEPMIAASIEWELVDAGYEVLGPAGSVAEAEALTARARPDLALVDINLAGHDEGIGLARALKSRFGLPVIFVTGQHAQARQACDAALGVLTKPFSFRSLVATVPCAMALAAGRRPARLPRGLEVFEVWPVAKAS
ncbi:response regulator [Phenylobacterium sp. J367]|uniref:response regulator n=1 Tax=Phenylobacterium sp. J367 TaxID=2898435 RepID=UPI0021511DF3|nr:response regulator [Phenylobacterium sp. J367]MCR5877554.1 response regulator [Phenylobacterium sp. J367]